jgi:hypothetical protein
MEFNPFGLGMHGKSPNVVSTRLQNAYYDFQPEKDFTKVSVHGTPGLSLFVDRGDTPWRGLHAFPSNSKLYGVHRGTFYDIDNAGTVTSRGTIGTTTGRVDIDDDGTRIAVVDGAEIYVYDTSAPATPIAAVADADRPTSPNTCCFQGARILTDENGTGQFKGGGNYAPTAWAALDVATAESNPDPVIRVINYNGVVALLGSYSGEFWQNVGGSGFPYSRILGAVLEYGLAARWSVGKFMGTFAFLAQNREGQVFVAKLNGFGIERISNNEFDTIINGYSGLSGATGYGYSLGGHPMYQINFPSDGNSWLYDGATKYWSELKSGTGRHRAELGVDFINQMVVADYSNGKLYRLDQDVYTDNGDTIQMQLTGKHIRNENKMLRLDRLEVNGEMGVGLVSGQGSDPQMILQLSKDGGHSFGTEMWADMGKIGEYARRCVFSRLGSGRDIVPRLTITDPVKRVLTTAVLSAEAGR